MSLNKQEILESIANMSVIDVCELVKAMEDKFGVSASTAVAVAAPAASEAPAEEQTEFTVALISFGSNKIAVIKAVRAITALGLKEAKEMVEGVPACVKEGVTKEEAESIKKQLEEAGATVEVK